MIDVAAPPRDLCEVLPDGAYLEADGEQGDDGRFYAEDVNVTRL